MALTSRIGMMDQATEEIPAVPQVNPGAADLPPHLRIPISPMPASPLAADLLPHLRIPISPTPVSPPAAAILPHMGIPISPKPLSADA